MAGCASHADRLVDARRQYFEGDLDAAASAIDRSLAEEKGDTDVLLLDKAIVTLFRGDAKESEAILRDVSVRLDHLEQRDLAEEAYSMVTDDRRRAYSGEDYEKVLLRAFLSLSNLMHDGADAGAYALQINAKQEQIIRAAAADGERDNSKQSYSQVALGPYLYGVLREETHNNYDDAMRSYAQVASWQPSFKPAQNDLKRVQYGHHSEQGNGVVYIFALVGRGPYKEESLEVPSSTALLIADRILSATAEYDLPPTVAPIKVPMVVVPRNEIDRVFVAVDGRSVGTTETVTDVGQLALQQQAVVADDILGRAIARRVIKKAVIYSTKDALEVNNGLLNFAINVAGVAWEASETADTRCWGLLPNKIQVLRVELPAGSHQLELAAGRDKSIVGEKNVVDVVVEDGRNTYLMASFPTSKIAGKVLQSTHY